MRATRGWVLLAMAMMLASSVWAADGGTVLRYKWAEGQQDGVGVTVETAGKITTTTSAGTQESTPVVNAAFTVFGRVEKVTPEGLAHLKISFGLVSFDTRTPDGSVVHGELNLAENTVTITAGGQKLVLPLPPGSTEMLAKGFTSVLDDRGQAKQIAGGGSVQEAFAKLPGAGGAPNMGQVMSGLDPILPEKAVKVGDTWEIKVPVGVLLGQPSAKPVILKFKYEDDETVDEVACRHFSAVVDVSDLTLSLPAAPGTDMRTEMTGFSLRATSDYYLSVADTHVVLAKSKAVESGTIHVEGTRKGPNGEDTDVDTTMVLDDFTVSTEIKRQ